ncbi:GNAT family N-acetyltransferase [Roseivivax sp.]
MPETAPQSTPQTAPLHLRPYAPADAEPLWRMLEPVFRAGETYAIEPDISRAEALDFWTGDGNRVSLAEDADGTILGSYFLRPNKRGGGAHVANAAFVTAPAAQGRGVARQMLAHAEAAARAAGFRAMQFNFVVAENTRAVATWERAGYAVVGRLPGAFHHPSAGYVDALVMMKHL